MKAAQECRTPRRCANEHGTTQIPRGFGVRHSGAAWLGTSYVLSQHVVKRLLMNWRLVVDEYPLQRFLWIILNFSLQQWRRVMARRELSIFVSGRSERDWRVVSMLGEFGPFLSRDQATQEAVRQASSNQPARVLVQNADGNYEPVFQSAVRFPQATSLAAGSLAV
jgi:hypothetical protein